MFDNNFSTRHNFIKTNNELNKKFDSNTYKNGQINKAAVDTKFENLSIQNEVLMSSGLARKKVLESAVQTSRDTVVDVPLLDKKEESSNSDRKSFYYNSENKGKNIISFMKEKNKNQDKGSWFKS